MLLFFNCYRISFSFKVSRNYKTSCFLGGLFVRRLTTWISQIIAAKLIQYLLFEVFSLDKLFSVKAQSPSQKCIIFNTFLPLFRLLILPFLIFRDVLCSVRHYLVLCWKIHPTPPPPAFRLQIFMAKGKKKRVQVLYLKILILVIIIKDLVPLTLDEPLTMSPACKSSH